MIPMVFMCFLMVFVICPIVFVWLVAQTWSPTRAQNEVEVLDLRNLNASTGPEIELPGRISAEC